MNLRSEIARTISLIEPLDELEKAHRDFVLQWIDSGAEIFRLEKPAHPPTHLVAYFLVFSPEESKILLVDHKKAELWLPSGGHVEIGEHPKETVEREALEELGVHADFLLEEPLFITVTETVGNVIKHTDVSLWYVLNGDPNIKLHYDQEEFYQIRWFGLDEIPFEKSDPHLHRFIQKLTLSGAYYVEK